MPAPNASYQVQEIPLKITGGTHFGRYPKISVEQTYNMIVSDDALVPYAGYLNVLDVDSDLEGRGIYTSYRGNFMIAIFGTQVQKITYDSSHNIFFAAQVGILQTNTGDVYINENNNSQICITDGVYVYVYNYSATAAVVFQSSQPGSDNMFDFPGQNPGYIGFQNGRLIISSEGTTNWFLSGVNEDTLAQDATVWSTDVPYVGSLQGKPDFIQATVPVPGGSNNLLVFGHNVAELWQDVGNALFPYQRNSTFSSDFGCINPSTIASLKDYIVWIGVNEQSGPVLMVYEGNQVQSISTDGIDYKIGNLTNADNCTGFLFQQDGHVIYQFTFPDDNLTYAYDFKTKLFFTITDENLNYHVARQVVYFGPTNSYYFVRINGGNLFELNTAYDDANYGGGDIYPIPRIRITAPFRLPSQRYFIVKSLGFTIEQGQPNQVTYNTVYSDTYQAITTESNQTGSIITTEDGLYICTEQEASQNPVAYYTTTQAAVYLSTSRNGGQTFGSFYPKNMNPTGDYKSRFIFQRLGQANDITFQLRFVGLTRFVVFDGEIEVYQ